MILTPIRSFAWWQIVLSVALIGVTIYGMVQLAGRIYLARCSG